MYSEYHRTEAQGVEANTQIGGAGDTDVQSITALLPLKL